MALSYRPVASPPAISSFSSSPRLALPPIGPSSLTTSPSATGTPPTSSSPTAAFLSLAAAAKSPTSSSPPTTASSPSLSSKKPTTRRKTSSTRSCTSSPTAASSSSPTPAPSSATTISTRLSPATLTSRLPPRNYPSSGSSVLLTLRPDQDVGVVKLEVLICGGAPPGSFQRASAREFVKALTTCGRIVVTDPNPTWEMEEMLIGLVMGNMLLLPTGDVLIINGAGLWTAGWELARDPVHTLVLYRQEQIAGSRFRTLRGSTVPQMYHSSAVVLSDSSVHVSGSNPHVYYNFTCVLFPTALSLESFSPPYLSALKAVLRQAVVPSEAVGYGQMVKVKFRIPGVYPRLAVAVTLLFHSFTTHSLARNQRHVVLRAGNTKVVSSTTHRVSVEAPPGYYMMFVVLGGVPSRGKWIKIH